MAGDIRNYREVVEALQGASVVFHVASYGMSGAESLRTDLISQVNVSGKGAGCAAGEGCRWREWGGGERGDVESLIPDKSSKPQVGVGGMRIGQGRGGMGQGIAGLA